MIINDGEKKFDIATILKVIDDHNLIEQKNRLFGIIDAAINRNASGYARKEIELLINDILLVLEELQQQEKEKKEITEEQLMLLHPDYMVE